MGLVPILSTASISELEVSVTAEVGSAGQVVPSYVTSSRVTIANTSAFGSLEFRVGSGPWIRLDRHEGSYLDLNLASTSVSMRKVGGYSLPRTARLTIEGVANAGANTSLSVPAAGATMALRASQATNGNLIDQGPLANALTNSGLVPVGWLASAAVALNAYRTPTVLNGRLYKCTTAGTNAASEPTWNTTIGGTTTSGTAVYTTEKGPYFVDGDGVRLFRSIASTQIGGAGTFILPASSTNAAWDMAQGQSLILNLRTKFDYAASGQAAASPIFSNRNLTSPNRGIRILGTGSTVQGIRVQLRDSNGVSILSGDTSAAFGLKPLDGAEHNVTVMIDAVLKMAYCYIDGVGLTQANMFDGATLCPNGMNLATLTGSTAGSDWTVGGDSGGATSFECAYKAIDVTVIQGGLPANIQAIASWYTRGGEGVLPQALVS